MPYTEQATLFACAGEALVGVLARPSEPTHTGVVMVVGGPQYRAGSHRQFVLLSRALAQAGFAVLRFDHRGMGDSSGAQRDFESISADIGNAIDHLQLRVPNVTQVILWGLCDAAAAALLYCHETHDSRVCGLCLLNPWVRSEASLAKTQVKHYYTQRLRQKEFWLKLLSGKVALGAVGAFHGFVQKLRQATGAAQPLTPPAEQPFQQRMASAWHDFGGRILLILSGDDFTAKEFVEYTQTDTAWKDYARHAQLTRHDIPHVDHTFSSAAARQQAEQIMLQWLTLASRSVG
jgi:exosortase A-associated hydrolase 1